MDVHSTFAAKEITEWEKEILGAVLAQDWGWPVGGPICPQCTGASNLKPLGGVLGPSQAGGEVRGSGETVGKGP